jgi:hypothetical protein
MIRICPILTARTAALHQVSALSDLSGLLELRLPDIAMEWGIFILCIYHAALPSTPQPIGGREKYARTCRT